MNEETRIELHLEEHERLRKLFLQDKVSFAQERRLRIFNNIESCTYADVEKLLALQKMVEQHFPEI
jgi:hypothetical protein